MILLQYNIYEYNLVFSIISLIIADRHDHQLPFIIELKFANHVYGHTHTSQQAQFDE